MGVAYQCAQQVRSAYHQTSHAAGRAVAEKILASFSSCPIPEIARLGRTLSQWREAFLAYFTPGGTNDGGTEAVNGPIELHRRVTPGFRNRENYRLRMLPHRRRPQPMTPHSSGKSPSSTQVDDVQVSVSAGGCAIDTLETDTRPLEPRVRHDRGVSHDLHAFDDWFADDEWPSAPAWRVSVTFRDGAVELARVVVGERTDADGSDVGLGGD